MTEPRIAISLLIAAMRRKAEASGGFSTILHKGNEIAGALLVIVLYRGKTEEIREYMPAFADRSDSLSGWPSILQGETNRQEHVDQYIQKRRNNDPDLWVIELDIANKTQLTAILAIAG